MVIQAFGTALVGDNVAVMVEECKGPALLERARPTFEQGGRWRECRTARQVCSSSTDRSDRPQPSSTGYSQLAVDQIPI